MVSFREFICWASVDSPRCLPLTMSKRALIAKLLHLNERTDRIAAFVTTIYVLWLLFETYLPNCYKLSGPLHHAVVFLEITVALLLFLYLATRLVLRNPNRRWLLILTDKECRSLKEWLAGKPGSPLLDSSRCKVKFADLTDLTQLSQVNYEAFVGTAYEASLEQLTTRNAGIIKRNSKCFLLFIDPIGGQKLVGYSCLIPLNALGTSLYLEGSVSDSTLRPELITLPEEVPTAVLIFAIHLRQEFSLARSGAARQYTLYFWTCVRRHIQELCGPHLKAGKVIDLYVQTQERSLYRRLTKRVGFKDSGLTSRDGYSILRLRLDKADV